MICSRPQANAFAQKRALAPAGLRKAYRTRNVTVKAETPQEAPKPKAAPPPVVDDLDLESEAQRKARRSEELRAQEKFMMVGTGEADCLSCGYKYEPKTGDPEYPIAPGTKFQSLPSDWGCPVCGAEKQTFQVQEQEIAGFAVNQQYGLGTNTMTSGQKSLLIYGSLAVFFALFLAGYFLE